MVYPGHPLLPLTGSFGPLLQEYRLPPEVHFPLTKREATLSILGTPPLILFAAQWSVSPIGPASNHTLIRAVYHQERAHAPD